MSATTASDKKSEAGASRFQVLSGLLKRDLRTEQTAESRAMASKHRRDFSRLQTASEEERKQYRNKIEIDRTRLKEKHRRERVLAKRDSSRPSPFGSVVLAFRQLRAFFRGGLAAARNAQVPLVGRDDYRDRMGATLAEYQLEYFHNKENLHKISWMGISTLKCVSDLWIYQELIHRTRPDVIVEIGSFSGGSTLFLANMCDIIGHGEVISLDICRKGYKVSHPRIKEITGDCSDPQIVQQVKHLTAGRKTMLIHDGDHRAEAVLRDLKLYHEFVSEGQYLIVEDGVVDLFNPKRVNSPLTGCGPLAAVDQFMTEFDDRFEVDEDCERFVLTANPRGYLRRRAA